MPTGTSPRFLVGIAAFSDDPGPIAFARFLAESGYGPNCCAGVHVIEHAAMLAETGEDTLAHVRHQADQRLRTVTSTIGGASTFATLDVLEGDTADATLLAAIAQEPGYEALIVGRRAASDQTRLVRLGGTVRRLLRALPVATYVVPPDLTIATLGRGPVVLAVDPSDSSTATLEYARELAHTLGRDLCVAHVIRDQWQTLAPQFDPTTMVAISQRHAAFARSAMDAWVMRNGLVKADVIIEEGPVIEQLAEIGKRRDACVMLCGSRRLSAFERIFASSHASELAARSAFPVGVVVPREVSSTGAP